MATATKPMPVQEASQVGDYIVEHEIGRGSFATVYKGYHRVSSMSFRSQNSGVVRQDAPVDHTRCVGLSVITNNGMTQWNVRGIGAARAPHRRLITSMTDLCYCSSPFLL